MDGACCPAVRTSALLRHRYTCLILGRLVEFLKVGSRRPRGTLQLGSRGHARPLLKLRDLVVLLHLMYGVRGKLRAKKVGERATRLDVLCELPGAVGVREAVPLHKVLGLALVLILRDDAVHFQECRIKIPKKLII